MILSHILYGGFAFYFIYRIFLVPNMGQNYVWALIFLYCLVLRHFINLRWHKKRFEKRIEKDKIVNYEIDSKQIKYDCEGLISIVMSWQLVTKLLIHKSGFLIFFEPASYHWIPRYSFQRETDFDAFKEIAIKNVETVSGHIG